LIVHAIRGAATMPPLHPDHMTADDRLTEIAEILALGLMRLHAHKSSPLSADRGDSSVDFLPDRSGHADAPRRRTA
jgi:hypothetical protein